MYNVVPYYVAKLLSEIPIFVIVPLVFNLIFYFLVGFHKDAEQFFKF